MIEFDKYRRLLNVKKQVLQSNFESIESKKAGWYTGFKLYKIEIYYFLLPSTKTLVANPANKAAARYLR